MKHISSMIFHIFSTCLLLLSEFVPKVALGVSCQNTTRQRAPFLLSSNEALPRALLPDGLPTRDNGAQQSETLSSYTLFNDHRTKRSVGNRQEARTECISETWEIGEPGDDDTRTVCSGVTVHSAEDLPALRSLRDCDIIDGSVEIAFIGLQHGPSNWSAISLPRVREITGFLLVNNELELHSLSTLLPALAVVRGHTLLTNYALVITSTRLREVGLISLQAVLRGSVFVQDNVHLRYTDTVDFEHLTQRNTTPPPARNVVQRDASHPQQQGARCPPSCSPAPDTGPRCWSPRHCQRMCPSCTQGCGTVHQPSHAGSSVSDASCCSVEKGCVGGCYSSFSSKHRHQMNCNACQHYRGPRGCTTTCPLRHTFLYHDYFCLSDAQCRKRRGHKPLKVGPKHLCLTGCPTGYNETKPGICVLCNTAGCRRECHGGLVSNIAALQALRRCSIITGPLIIRIPGLHNLNRELELALGDLVLIRDYLHIEQCVGITTLRGLGQLTTIGGETLYQDRYAVYVNNNEHLSELWPTNHSLTIGKGSCVFVNNPRLCSDVISDLVTSNGMVQPLSDHLLRAVNGYSVSCGEKIQDLSVRGLQDGSVAVTWRPLDPAIERNDNILGFFIYFRPTTATNLSLHRDTSRCSSQWSSHYVDRHRQVGGTLSKSRYILPATLVKAYTRYAIYLETYSTITSTIHSDIEYAQTAVAAPSPPEEVRVLHSSARSLEVSWRPPHHSNGRLDHYIISYSALPDHRAHDDHPVLCDTQADGYQLQVPSPAATEKSARMETQSRASLGTALEERSSSCSCRAPAVEAPQIVESLELAIHQHQVSSQRCTARVALYHSADGGKKGSPVEGTIRRRREEGEVEEEEQVQNSSPATHGQRSDEMDTVEAWQRIKKDGNSLHAVINNLHHNTFYRLQVRACNCAEHVPRSHCSPICSDSLNTHLFTTTTDPSADTVTNVTATVVDDGILQVSWQPPTAPNSPPREYRLTVARGNLTVMGECLPPAASPSLSTQPLPTGSYVLRIVTRTEAGDGAPYTSHFTVTDEAGLHKVMVVAGPVLAVVALLVLVVAVCWRRRRAAKALPVIEYEKSNHYSSLLQGINRAFVHSPDRLHLHPTTLGSGEFGKVFQADLELECGLVVKVAVKRLQANSLHDPNIEREAKIMLKLRSCHVVRSYGVVVQAPSLLLVLELMPEGDLHTFLRNQRAPDDDILKKLQVKQVVGWAAQVADGMLYLSHHRIVHRDLAARNCLLDQDYNVKVSDFGLSRPIETDSRDFYQMLDCTVKIPFRSMPPEFLKRGVYGFQSDVWSFGVLLWEILRAGATPYGNKPKEDIESSVRLGITLQGSLPPSCPPFLEQLMVHCWSFCPRARPTFKHIIATLLPTLQQHSRTFQQKFMKDAFYFTLEEEHGLCSIPPPPQIPLPPVPCPLPSTSTHNTQHPSTYNTHRPTSLHIRSPFYALDDTKAPISASIYQKECPGYRRVDAQAPASPDIISPTSTVSTLLSPAPLATSEEEYVSPRENHLLERIKTGLSAIQVPLEQIKPSYSKMNHVRTKERGAMFFSNSDSVPGEVTDAANDQEGKSSNARVSLNQDDESETSLLRRESVYQDMNQAAKPRDPDIYELFQNSLTKSNEHSMIKSVVDDSLSATEFPECERDNLMIVESEPNLADTEFPIEDTLDAKDLSSSCDSLHRNHHYGGKGSGLPIVNLGIETPPPSRNNSVGSNQASSGETVANFENTAQLNLIKDPLFVACSSLHID